MTSHWRDASISVAYFTDLVVHDCRLVHLVGRVGLEPTTFGARVRCSTNWAPTHREPLIPRPDAPRMEPSRERDEALRGRDTNGRKA